MNKSILITGIPGTGKSTIAQILENRGYNSIDMEEVDGLFAHFNRETNRELKDYNSYKRNLDNIKKYDWNCNIDMLKKMMAEESNRITFFCGTASNLFDFIALFDRVILLTIDNETLQYRLAHRDTNDFGNTVEVQKWIMSWRDWFEKNVRHHNPITIDSSGSLDAVIDDIVSSIDK